MTITEAAPSREVEPLTPVLFRVSFEDEPEGMDARVTAILVCEPFSLKGDTMTCYAHVGQHGECSWQWVQQKTRPATPAEYEPLKRELESIGYNLRVFKYRTRPHKIAFAAALERMRKS